jgi:putative peptidoglycan lipid II flippase
VTTPGSSGSPVPPALPVADEPGGEQAVETGAVSRAAGIGRAAALIGGLTVVARILGLARTLVFSGTVHSSCLGVAYFTANQVPNVIYDIVLGGALTAIVVPVLARPAEQAAGDEVARRERDAISSALLTWTVVILAPVSLILALAAGPAMSALIPANPGPFCSTATLVPLAARMLAAFAPQILLYGLAVVSYGILQAHRKFSAPALAPVLSSLVVIAAYLLFVPLGQQYTTFVRGLPTSAELMLSVGTTLGVAALVVTAILPVWRLRIRLRPTLRFPAGIARRARGLAGVGVATLVAQDVSVLVVVWLANAHGKSSVGPALPLYNYSWQIFVSVYAVLAIPIAISAFTVLSARKGAEFDATAASATRVTALASWLGAALLAGAAFPIGRAFPGLGEFQPAALALALMTFAPGLVGYGLTACLSRVLLADGRNRTAAVPLVAGWLLVIVIDLVAIPLVPAWTVVWVLGLANTAGMTVSGVALVIAVARTRGAAALAGCWRAVGAGFVAAVAGAAAGLGITGALHVYGTWPNSGVACAAGLGSGIAFILIVALLDGGDLRTAVARVRRRVAS